jgi:hypothetical protein
MTIFTLVFGIALIGTGFVVLVRKVHDRTIHQALTQARSRLGW